VTEVIPARATTYKGVRMRSRLEADYAAYLDAQGKRWEYEPECFASENGQWLPDFAVEIAGGPCVRLTEVKPAGPLQAQLPNTWAYVEHVDSILKRMTIAWASKPDAFLHLTFWEYGEDAAYLDVYSAAQGAPWFAATAGAPIELLWTGMGQYDRSRTDPGVFTCSIRKGHWECSCGCDVRRDGPIGPDDVCIHLSTLGNLPHRGT
jgi:hypothetical protein